MVFATCWDNLINTLSCVLFLVGVSHLVRLNQAPYGRYLDLGLSSSSMPRMVPARLAWFLQELPSLLVPLMMMTTTPNHTGSSLLLGTFCLHYFQRYRTASPVLSVVVTSWHRHKVIESHLRQHC
uniref:Steroid 5-alpha reductase C-terminal domain-containing protein n=1 Tax=Hucho hucho TaxID=62062 RepID=A0A4W5JBL6_9TELE